MATYANFIQNFSVCQQNNCGELVITDTSEGWGAGVGQLPLANLDRVDISITRYNKDNTTVTDDFSFTGLAGTITSQSQLVWIFSTLSGTYDGSTSTSDGHIEIEITYYTAGDVIVNSSITNSYFLFCTVECCVNKLIAGIYAQYNCNDCDKTYTDMALTANGLLESLKAVAACGDYTKAYQNLTTLQNICGYTDCNCGQ